MMTNAVATIIQATSPLFGTGAGVAVQALNGPSVGWWTGVSFSSNNPVYQIASFVGTTSGTWTYNLPQAFQNALVSGTSYYIVARSTDVAGNTEFGPAAGNIPGSVGTIVTYNVTAPTATIVVPSTATAGIEVLNTTSGTVTGKVTVSSVAIAIQDQFDGSWMKLPGFNFALFQSTPNFIPVTNLTGNSWTFNAGGGLNGQFKTDHKYNFVARATDAAGAIQSTFT